MNRYDDNYRGDFQRYEYEKKKYSFYEDQKDIQHSSKKISSFRPNERLYNHSSHSEIKYLSMHEKKYTYNTQTLDFSDEFNSKKSKRQEDFSSGEYESDYFVTKKKKINEWSVKTSDLRDEKQRKLEKREHELRLSLLEPDISEGKSYRHERIENRSHVQRKTDLQFPNKNLPLKLLQNRSTSQESIRAIDHNVRPAHNYDQSFQASVLTGQKEIKNLLITAKEHVAEASINNAKSIYDLRIQFLEEENKMLKDYLELEKTEKNRLLDELKEHKAEKNNLEDDLKELKSEKNKLVDDLKEYKTENDKLNDYLEIEKGEKNKLASQLKELKVEKNKLNDYVEIEKTKSNNLNKYLEIKKGEKDKLADELKNLKAEKKRLNDYLEIEKIEKNKLADDLKEIKVEKNKINDYLEIEKAEKNKLQDELKEKNAQISTMLKLLNNESENQNGLPPRKRIAFKIM